MRLAYLPAAALVGALVGNACLLELDHALACGDGFRDGAAGEECDPADARSYAHACDGPNHPRAHPGCDPVTCTLLCNWCGDGYVDTTLDANGDPLEECDPADALPHCPGEGTVTCVSCKLDTSGCLPCGNGIVDEGEECDPKNNDGIAIPRPCAGAAIGTPEEIAPLISPYRDSKPYTSGTAVGCLEDCTFDRSNCGYCGDGRADDETIVNAISGDQTVKTILPEDCDGDDPNEAAMDDQFPECDSADMYVVANVDCDGNCHFTTRDGPECCLKTGAPCPLDTDVKRCCHEFAHPEIEDHCSDPFLPPGVDPPEDGGGRTCK